jgi:hypothetical protein
MGYYSDNRNVKETVENKTVAVATHEKGAEIIVCALNFYFGNSHTSNEAIEMMHKNTSNALKSISEYLKKHPHTRSQTIDYIQKLSELLDAQALVVSMRDELKFDRPKD